MIRSIALISFSCFALLALADEDRKVETVQATLTGYEEVLPVYTTGFGEMSVRVEQTPPRLTVTLKYTGLTSVPVAAHLHWGQSSVNGPIILAICGGEAGSTCPASNDSESTFTFPATALAGVATQNPTGFFPGENLAALIAGLRNGVVYGDVHTQQFGGGEIRGQFARVRRRQGQSDSDKRYRPPTRQESP